MSYILRRLKLRGLIRRIPNTHRYEVTDLGLAVALFYTMAYNRILRPGLAEIADIQQPTQLAKAFRSVQNAMDHHCSRLKAAA